MDFDYGLLAKYLVDKLSPAEMEAVMLWCDLSAENKKIFSDLVNLRLSQKYTQYNASDKIERALNLVNARIKRTYRLRIVRRVSKYAAAILLLVSCSYAGWYYLKPETYVTIAVDQNAPDKQLVLADGTTVWLKAGSSLRMPEGFSDEKRDVFLQGEAFFDVVKNTESPFSVSTKYINLKVLGTAFDVKVDEACKKVETVLVRGKVALLDREWKSIMDMSPGEKVTYKSLQNEYVTESVDVNVHAVWRLGQLVFEDVTLREIANQLSAKFNVNINISSSRLAGRKFRCVINKDETLTDIFELLTYMTPMHYKIEGNEIFLFERERSAYEMTKE